MKKIKYLLAAFIFLILCPLRVTAAELELTFKTTGNDIYDEDQLIVPTYDATGEIDGTLICFYGEDYNCSKYNLKNELLWTNKEAYNDNIYYDTIGSNEKESIIVNGETDVLLYLYSDDATVQEPLWYVQYGGSSNELAIAAINSYDNKGKQDGYILFLVSSSTDIEGINPGYIMVKYDLNGKQLWNKNTNNISPIILTENNFIFATENTLIKTNFVDIIWETATDMYINKIIESKTEDGTTDGYIVIGTGKKYTYNPNDYFWFGINPDGKVSSDIWNQKIIAKYDLNGNEIWYGYNDEYSLTCIYDIIESRTPSGMIDGYIAVGTAISFPPTRLDEYFTSWSYPTIGLIIKYDLKGNVVWQKVHDETQTAFTTISESYNTDGKFNGYIIAGKTYELETNIQPQYAIKTLSPTMMHNAYIERVLAENKYENIHQYIVKYTYQDYKIATETVTGGNVNVNINAFPGEIVPLYITVEDGYILERIAVFDKEGNELKITNNTFVMPEGEVTVKAIFKRMSNPQTAAIGYTIVFIILIVSIATFTVNNQKLQVIED